ncbi:MAG: hypothetical protein IPM69_14005 [Ignavibacteria bacterium]|nr:hypothetical protein [Ignavibacteria bacterium]
MTHQSNRRKNSIIVALVLIIVGLVLAIVLYLPQYRSGNEIPLAKDVNVEVGIIRFGYITKSVEKNFNDSITMALGNALKEDTLDVKFISYDSSYLASNFSAYRTLNIRPLTDTTIRIKPQNLVYIEYYLNSRKIFVFDWYLQFEFNYLEATLGQDTSLSQKLKIILSNQDLSKMHD